jgi:hypothetical protein
MLLWVVILIYTLRIFYCLRFLNRQLFILGIYFSIMNRKIKGGILVTLGFLLSPVSWWNDIFVNIPLAYIFALPFGFMRNRSAGRGPLALQQELTKRHGI